MRSVRRDDVTHPRELPDRERFTPLADLVRETGEKDPCQVCHEPGTVDDPVGHFKNPAQVGAYVMAHGDCGEANGLELA